MEGQPQYEAGLPAEEAARAAERERRIKEALQAAWRRGRRIDDWTAKHIAQTLDPGDGPLHEFAETGAIPEGMEAELAIAAEVIQDLDIQEELPPLTALGEYFAGRLLKSAMPYWNDPSME